MSHARTKGGPTDGLCKCEWCKRWSPLLHRIQAIAQEHCSPFTKREFRVFVNHFINRDEDASVAECKLRGEWPGWKWITKEVKKRKLSV